jgi:ribose 5-phosphate isomerase B
MTNNQISLLISSDHAGFELKEKIKNYLLQKGFKVTDFGTNSSSSVDYPDYVHPLCQSMSKANTKTLGIVICGSGNGVNITANKYQHIRSALCWISEIAILARKHNDANVLAMPARFISEQTAIEITDAFLNTSFEGGRHQDRVNKISCSTDI